MSSTPPVFTVQRHRATRLHFDLRLQIGDVLVSWAVPRGPSLDPRDKRLAVRTDDHALDYADFEGVTSGGSTVIVWDIGTLTNLTERDGRLVPLEDALRAGHLKVRLGGQRLRGAFALTRTAMDGDPRNWLLVKVADADADRISPIDELRDSVLTGRTNEDLELPW